VQRREERRREAEERNRRYREERARQDRLAPLETEISRLETRLRELDARLADPAVYRDPQRAREAGQGRLETREQLERLYAQWEAAAAVQE
ncbi:MAG TPA: ABC transporter C-terminal domain-containing protein, partial [Candidatus Polarisedimenticolaceae bacterium]|nr:ABC transporter C-terminal domain-containing protein [Candidatus Polarisedimenticolaceae bacterium]